MQTFLPYADFDRSAASLDSPRLGKQRVETLQLLRALTFANYGWQSHPAKVMWEGFVPALVSYGLAMVDAWTGRGGADSTRIQIAEFAPEAVSTPAGELDLPSWLGMDVLHVSHQSNLIRKDRAFYIPQFPGVADNLDYFWPGADPSRPVQPRVGEPLVIFRPRDDAQLASWIETKAVTMGEESPRGGRGPKWLAQLERFSTLPSGTRFGALESSGQRLWTGTVTGEAHAFGNDGEIGLRRSAAFDGELERSAFPYPALLQDPQSLFEVVGPRA